MSTPVADDQRSNKEGHSEKKQDSESKSTETRPMIEADDTTNYAVELTKRVNLFSGFFSMELSLFLLIRNAASKVRRALADYYTSCHQSLILNSAAVNRSEFIGDPDADTPCLPSLDSLVKKADARREINKILNVVERGREELETRHHPLLILAEATAFRLKKHMDFLEEQKPTNVLTENGVFVGKF
ncbi:unnamed protein product [Gongylonema pulchrum]|uniref:Ferritin domain-containing protein n=1 Tax=Gongylonema pulchrum TaxID=637853 RepID=A0A183EMZ0_9BILA|nr:unnamed protein product [Gongylonema pulchrum]